VVFVTGLEYGVFPHYKSLLNESDLEEERRLAYVAITRAKERLFLSYARLRRLYGKVQANPPSNFLEEIPSELTVRENSKGKSQNSIRRGGQVKSEKLSGSDSDTFEF